MVLYKLNILSSSFKQTINTTTATTITITVEPSAIIIFNIELNVVDPIPPLVPASKSFSYIFYLICY